MTLEQFHNGLRILRSIDSYELGNPEWWPAFAADPYQFLIRASDQQATIIWSAMLVRGAGKTRP